MSWAGQFYNDAFFCPFISRSKCLEGSEVKQGIGGMYMKIKA